MIIIWHLNKFGRVWDSDSSPMIQSQSFLGLREDIQEILPYIDMVTILLNGAEPFEQIGNTLSTERHMWNLVKIAQAVSQKTFKNYTILYMYIAEGQEQITPRGQNLIITKCFTRTSITHCKFQP